MCYCVDMFKRNFKYTLNRFSVIRQGFGPVTDGYSGSYRIRHARFRAKIYANLEPKRVKNKFAYTTDYRYVRTSCLPPEKFNLIPDVIFFFFL